MSVGYIEQEKGTKQLTREEIESKIEEHLNNATVIDYSFERTFDGCSIDHTSEQYSPFRMLPEDIRPLIRCHK